MIHQPMHRAGLYLRLSKDDEATGESASIQTQRSILRDYANAHNIFVFDEYMDDGYTGTNFDRPDYKRMIADIEAGKVNCVIVKDLSRLGRNSAKTAELLDEYFPAKGVRCIAVTEGFDTYNLSMGLAMTAPFMLLMNELYARDISNKIRASFQVKMEKGEYIGNFAPYGYRKDPENKNHLVPDPVVSHIVQKIFRMAQNGASPGEIAKVLNEKGVATPLEYRCLSRAYVDRQSDGHCKEWTASGICKMLKNRVYLGHTQQGKTTKVSFKSKSTRRNKEPEWIEVLNTHAPLVDVETFNFVQNRCVARRNSPHKEHVNIFSGIAKCADCGRNMTMAPAKKNGTYYLTCGGYKSYGAKKCSNHFIGYDELCSVVLQELKVWLVLSKEEKERIIDKLVQEEAERDAPVKKNIDELKKRGQKVSFLMKRAHEDACFGRISDIAYRKLLEEYEAENSAIERTVSELKKETEPVERKNARKAIYALLEHVAALDTLPPQLLKRAVERIEVFQGYYEEEQGMREKHQQVKIYYRFMNSAERIP